MSADRDKFDMTLASAAKAVQMVFRSPAEQLKIEFQGGEPMLNFPVIMFIVEEAENLNATHQKDLRFVLSTNLASVSDDILAYCKAHNIGISTSLDGPAFLHNSNRPRPEHNAHELVVNGIEQARSVLGHHSVSALMTTTKLSLSHPVEIVEEYVYRGFDHIFLRPISPYGFARKSERLTGYEVRAFVDFYIRAFDQILEVNRRGYPLSEVYATIILTKILTPFTTNYVDLRSPSGAGIGVVVYNYDGDVYATDEARMLAEMGDTRFRLGNLHTDSYEQMFGGPLIRELAAVSCVETVPGCSDCAVNAYCGSDPIENFATQGDIVGHRPSSSFCIRNMAIIKHLLTLYHSGDPFIEELFWSWVHNAPASELLPSVPE